MITLLITLGALAAAWGLAFVGAPLLVWTLAVGLGLTAGVVTGWLGAAGSIAWGATFALLVLLNLVPLRRALLTRPIFAAFKAVLPEMSATEREALEAGDVWWEAELFRGRPDWKKLLEFKYTPLTQEEQSFLDNECEELCRLCDDWKIEFETRDLPPEAWAYIKEKKFFAMLIKKEFGGLGFSAAAQSAVVTKLATKSITLAVTVMVPNSLGPGELLMYYGTEAQQKQWLPGLVDGREIPCFGLTGPEAGSDATAMPDNGVVCWGEIDGKKTLGLKLNFSKRYITLAPVATVIGLAFKLRDPDGLLGDQGKTDYGITCALIPRHTPGVEIGRRHYPGGAFMNGTIHGHDVFVPLDAIIGGPQMAGKGWRMLVECLSAGRGISLPALATAGGQTTFRMIGAYARLRRQFKLSIGKFEGIQEPMGRIGGYTYTLEAMRIMTASAVDHCAPSVVTAIAKYHMTELLRKVVNDGMDITAGRGVQNGPRNFLSTAYRVTPVAITVEGANILTRNLMIFGQGAIRCHDYVFPQMEAARANDLVAFDKLFFGHVGSVVNRGARALALGLSGGVLASSPVAGRLAPYFRQMERMSATLYFASNVTMGVLGGSLKFRERLSARLGDVLSQLYIASCVAKYFLENGQKDEDWAMAKWALDNAFHEMGKAYAEFCDNFPVRPAGALMRFVGMPFGNPYRSVSDRQSAGVAEQMMQAGAVRDRLSWLVYKNGGDNDAIGRMEAAWTLAEQIEPAYNTVYKAAHKGELGEGGFAEQVRQAVAEGLIDAAEAKQVLRFDTARADAMATDDFSKAYLAGNFAHDRAEVLELSSARSRVA